MSLENPDYRLVIKPAIPPEQRHQIEAVLSGMGFHVHGGGTYTDMSQCDITFSKSQKEE